MLDPADHRHLRRRHGFTRHMRRLIRTSALPYRDKAAMFWALAQHGPDAAWELYKAGRGKGWVNGKHGGAA